VIHYDAVDKKHTTIQGNTTMSNFASLKRSSKDELSKLTEHLKKLNTNENRSSDDDRMWYPDVDKAGNGYAVIRFLPAPANEDVPFIRMWEHGFKGPSGQWYIEKSLTTIGKEDPVSEYNTQLWNSTSDDNSPARKQARDQKRNLVYISNIYVVKDPAKPQNEGKVFLYKYGKKIFDKLNEAMNPNPQFDEKPMNPFDLWNGANFKLKIRKLEGYRNYDKSEFDERGPLSDDDDELEKIYNSEHSLKAFLDPKNFKDYDTLKKKLHTVLGLTQKVAEEAQATMPRAEAPQPKAVHVKPHHNIHAEDTPAEPVADDEDDDLSYFKKLAND